MTISATPSNNQPSARRSKIAASVIALSLLGAACGSSSTKSASSTSPTTGASATSAATSAPVNLNLVQPGILTAATQSDEYPFAYTGSNGQLEGFSIDLMNQIASGLGLKVQYKAVAFSGLLADIAAHQYDVGAIGVAVTSARQQTVTFSEPYYYGYFGIIAQKSSDFTSVSDLNGKTVAVVQGTVQETYAKQHYPQMVVKDFPSQPTALAALDGGQVSAFFLGGPDTARYIKANPSLSLVAAIQTTTPNAFPVGHGNTSLADAINGQLNKMYADGAYVTTYKKWFSVGLPPTLVSEYPVLANQ